MKPSKKLSLPSNIDHATAQAVVTTPPTLAPTSCAPVVAATIVALLILPNTTFE